MARRVALDIGPADPSAAREAATRALAHDGGLHVTLVGPVPEGIRDADRLAWRAATPPSPDVDPAVAVRGQADLSVRVALELGRDGEVDTVVSATPLSALLTGARFLLRRRTGVRDPLVAVTLDTPAGDVVVLDVSGRPGTTPGSLLGAATDLGPLPDRLGLLEAGAGDQRAVSTLAGQSGVDVRHVSAAEVLVGAVRMAFADGAAGGLFLDTVRALAPARVGPIRLVGLDHAPAILPAGPDPATWSAALTTSAAVAS